MKKWLAQFKDKAVWIITAIAFGFGILYGLLEKPFLLNFINGITYAGIILLAIGIGVSFWKDGGMSQDKSKGAKKMLEERKKKQKERENVHNPCLCSGIVVMVIAILMACLY